MTMNEIQIQIQPEQDGLRLDRVLAERPEVGSRTAAGRLIAAGGVSGAAGVVRRKSEVVAAGEQYTLRLTEVATAESGPPAVPFAIVYEDDWLLVVDKPAGLVVHPAPGHRSGTLSQALAGRAGGGDPARAGIVHRLDQDTSGLLVVARDDATLRALQKQLQERDVTRRYTALVKGAPQSSRGTIDAPLGRDRRDPANISIRRDSSRPAVTHFETRERLGGRTLLGLELETGRTHQIRVHLAAVGLPVCGDAQYGVAGDLGLTRQFLHAAELSFTHPATGDRVSFSSELPKELAAALDAARAGR